MNKKFRLITIAILAIFTLVFVGCAGDGDDDSGETTDNLLLVKKSLDSPKTLARGTAQTVLIVDLINTADPSTATQAEEFLVTGCTLSRQLSNNNWTTNFDTIIRAQAPESIAPFPIVGANQQSLASQANMDVSIQINPPIYLRAGDVHRLHITETTTNATGTLKYILKSLTVRRISSADTVTVRRLDPVDGSLAESPTFQFP